MSCGRFIEGDFGRYAGLDNDRTAGIRANSIMTGNNIRVRYKGGGIWRSSDQCHNLEAKSGGVLIKQLDGEESAFAVKAEKGQE